MENLNNSKMLNIGGGSCISDGVIMPAVVLFTGLNWWGIGAVSRYWSRVRDCWSDY